MDCIIFFQKIRVTLNIYLFHPGEETGFPIGVVAASISSAGTFDENVCKNKRIGSSCWGGWGHQYKVLIPVRGGMDLAFAFIVAVVHCW